MNSRLLLLAALTFALGAHLHAKTPDGKPLVLLLAGRPSHGPGEHEHNAGVQLLAKCLAQGAPNVAVKFHLNAEWPSAEELAQADTVVFYCDGGPGHFLVKDGHLDEFSKVMQRGAGLVCLHYGVEFPADIGGPQALDWMGGFFEADWSVNPHWLAEFTKFPQHPICKGVKPFSTTDEWYFHMRFREDGKGKLTHILSAIPPESTMSRPDGSHSGNATVRAEVAAKKPQTTAWAYERADGGRGFGFTGGHFHAGWSQEDQRKLVLNAILWTAKVEVPAGGVISKVTDEDLTKNLDSKPPRKPRQAGMPAPRVPLGFAAAKENMSKFTAAAGLDATLFAAEPMIQNPTNIDIDPRGRIWALESVNYRAGMRDWGTLREAGDRVVILEGAGEASKETTFYQSPELTNPLGICVLPQEKGTRVIVSAAPNVWLLTDEDGDDKADKAEIIFQTRGNWNHDHQIHAFSFGADGKFYFNCGNESRDLLDGDGNFFTDLSGNRTAADGKPYRQGMVFRCDLVNGKPANVETLGWNFRNNYEVCVDSFGTMWQSDNDDDGNKGVRINYVMQFGNYGYTDEMTGAAWRAPRSNLEHEIPLRHWHLNDPGVVPNLLQTGAGSPTGILVNESAALGPQLENQLIHCDAGPRTVRAYPVAVDGAGYKATMVDVLTSEDPWYRPADVAIAPDGSLYVADWYDGVVGGHNMIDHVKGEVRGRIYRVAPTGGKLSAPTPDFSTAAGCVAALQSPNRATMYLAWQRLAKLGADAEPQLAKLWKESANPRLRARALGLLARLPGTGLTFLREGLTDACSDLRVTAVRLCTMLARTDELDTSSLEEDRALMAKLMRDPSPQVRREIALSLHGEKKIAQLWAALAMQHDGRDRWYLEALGIGAAGNEEACFDAWLAMACGNWNTPGGRDIVWRLRTQKAAACLATLLEDGATTDKLRYVRAFDFLPPSPERTNALVQIATVGKAADDIAREALVRLKGAGLEADPAIAAALKGALEKARGTPQFVALVRDFGATGQEAALLDTALKIAGDPATSDALKLFFAEDDAKQLLADALAGSRALAVIDLLGVSGGKHGVARLSSLVTKDQEKPDLRQACVRALARTQAGAEVLVKLATNAQLTPELTAIAGSALRLVQYASLTKEIDRLFPAPVAFGGKPLPAITELAKLKGDIAKGRAVFERTEASCIICHRVNDKGVDFAPALSEIGSKFAKDALYDSILNPNAGLSVGFETTQLAMKDGSAGLGIVRSETADDLVLALPGGATTKFAKNAIVKRDKLTTSMMPSGLNQALSQDDLVNLVEYLASLKKK